MVEECGFSAAKIEAAHYSYVGFYLPDYSITLQQTSKVKYVLNVENSLYPYFKDVVSIFKLGRNSLC